MNFQFIIHTQNPLRRPACAQIHIQGNIFSFKIRLGGVFLKVNVPSLFDSRLRASDHFNHEIGSVPLNRSVEWIFTVVIPVNEQQNTQDCIELNDASNELTFQVNALDVCHASENSPAW